MDEWYRLAKDAGCEIHRKAPDFYTHAWAWTLYDERLRPTDRMKENIKITLVNDAGGGNRGEWSWPGQFAPDHTSGKAYETPYPLPPLDPLSFY
jgi:hypothetical protein